VGGTVGMGSALVDFVDSIGLVVDIQQIPQAGVSRGEGVRSAPSI